MKCLLCQPVKWLLKQAGVPSCEDAYELYRDGANAWDHAQVEDQFVDTSDPDIDEFRAARALQETNPDESFRRYLELASAGSVNGMLNVGSCYHNGVGVEPDGAQMREWYRRAAEAGSQYAQLYYGRQRLADRDFAEAERIFEIGAQRDWAPALYWLAVARLKQSKSPRSYAEALPLLERAVEKGSLWARWTLAGDMARGRFGLRRVRRGMQLRMALCQDLLELLKADNKGQSLGASPGAAPSDSADAYAVTREAVSRV